MLTIIAPHPNLLRKQYPRLQELVDVRLVRVCDYHNWRGLIGRNDQVVIVSCRAILSTQIVTPSMRNDYSCVYTQIAARTAWLAVVHSLPRVEH